MLRALFSIVLLCCVPAVAAQATNAEAMGRLAAACLSEVPAAGPFALHAPALPLYLRDALVPRWQAGGRRVFADTASTLLPRLALDAPAAEVVYRRAGRQRYKRTVTLQMGYVLTNPDGEVVRTGTCDDTFEDTVDARRLDALESPVFAETIGQRPPPGWVRRYAEPAVLGAAVAVSTVLFFSLRSR